ncbi:MAG: hypothetical protein IJX63_04610 [Lachnospiraceae bacterium]|nr:hypothetical protein [Lachnospiraceae bacterium]
MFGGFVAGKGGVGKTFISAIIIRCLIEKYPDKKILAIDADPTVADNLIMYEKVRVIVNHMADISLKEYVDTKGITVLSYISDDKNLSVK